MSSLNFDKLYPWKNIETVTIDDQQMVKIPAFYVRCGLAPSGTDTAGRKCWWVSAAPRAGYHLHPAFIHNGSKLEQFYIGAYEAYNTGDTKAGSAANKSPWVSIDFSQAKTVCEARNSADGEISGFHLQNYYERSAIALLMMIELGSPDVQQKIGAGNSSSSGAVATGKSNAVWRGIHEFWGNVWEWCDGIKTASDGKTILVHDNNGMQTYINTGATLPSMSNNGIQSMQDAVGENFDLSDMFIPKEASSSAAASTFSDGGWMAAGSVKALLCGGRWDGGASGGAFAFDAANAPSYSGTDVGLRLAKW